MRLSAFALAALVSATAAMAQPQAPAAPASGAFSAAQVAQSIQPRLPLRVGDTGANVTAVVAEGQTLIWTVALPAAAPAASGAEFADRLVRRFCAQGAAMLFQQGISVRVDTTANGAPASRGPVLTSCPAA